MNKAKRNFLVDTTLISLILVATITGLLVWLVFPFHSGRDELTLLLEDIHKWASVTLVIVTVYHLVTHWEWYKKTFQNLRRL